MNLRFSVVHWQLITLIAWGAIALVTGVVHFSTLGIDEASAHGLLLNWSISDQIINPVYYYGIPDFRALLFIPLGLYWPGSMVAAKVFTLLFTYAAAMVLYRWSKRLFSDEVALLSTGLILIAPATLAQVNALGIGPFMVTLFGLGYWLDNRYRAKEKLLSAPFFLLVLTSLSTVTLHPMGLALPLALCWGWHRNPINPKMQQHLFIGLAVSTLVVLLLQAGWDSVRWFANPVSAIGAGLLPPIGLTDASIMMLGLLGLALLITVVLINRLAFTTHVFGQTLLFSAIIGLVAADDHWAFVVGCLVLLGGVSSLIKLQKSFHFQGFWGQRGVVLLVVFALTTLFMQTDKAQHNNYLRGQYGKTDQLIETLLSTTHDRSDPFKTISQWPSKTMLALKRPVLPMPTQRFKNGEDLLAAVKGIEFLIFDPKDEKNKLLVQNLAQMSGKTETVALQNGGAIIRFATGGKVTNATDPAPK